jgi:hypothetical protein
MNGETRVPTAGELGIAVRSERDIIGLVSAALSHPGLIVTEADLPAVHGTRFSELAAEHRRHRLIRFFESEAAARRWFAELQ